MFRKQSSVTMLDAVVTHGYRLRVMNFRSFAAPLLALSFTFVNPCHQKSKPDLVQPSSQDEVFPVEVTYPQFITQPRMYEIGGVFSPSAVHEISARYNAIISEVPVNEGAVVKKDDMLVVLASDELQSKLAIKQARIKELGARLKEAQAKVNFYGRDDRPVSDSEIGFIDDEHDEDKPTDPKEYGDNSLEKPTNLKELIDTIETQLDTFTREAEDLDRVSSELVQKSSVNGVVIKKIAVEGNRALQNAPLLEIAETDPMTVEFHLPREVASFVDNQSKVQVAAADNPEAFGEGQVIYISPDIDASTDTITVRANVSNTQGLIKGGQDAKVKVATRRLEKMLMLPKTAIVKQIDKNYIFVVYGNQVHLVEVRLGDDGPNDTIEVVADLRVDDPIVVSHVAELKNNSFVKIVSGGMNDHSLFQ